MFEVHFIAEGSILIKAKNWNEAEAEFDKNIKPSILESLSEDSVCEVVCIQRCRDERY